MSGCVTCIAIARMEVVESCDGEGLYRALAGLSSSVLCSLIACYLLLEPSGCEGGE